jgi:hypothetical protein
MSGYRHLLTSAIRTRHRVRSAFGFRRYAFQFSAMKLDYTDRDFPKFFGENNEIVPLLISHLSALSN